MKIFSLTLFSAALLLSGCDRPVQAESTISSGGGAIEAINHTSWAINHFSVNGVNSIDIIGPYQGGGGGGSYAAPPGLETKPDSEG